MSLINRIAALERALYLDRADNVPPKPQPDAKFWREFRAAQDRDNVFTFRPFARMEFADIRARVSRKMESLTRYFPDAPVVSEERIDAEARRVAEIPVDEWHKLKRAAGFTEVEA